MVENGWIIPFDRLSFTAREQCGAEGRVIGTGCAQLTLA
jgi:hypothetical protein